MVRKHRKLLFFVIAFFVITVGGSFLYKEGLLYDSPIALPVLIPTSIPVPKVNMYNSSKYEFRFSYPNKWDITYWDLQDKANLSTVPEGSIQFQVEVSSEDENFEVLIWENRFGLPASSWVRTYLHEEILKDIIPTEYNTEFLGYSAIRFMNESIARGKPLEYIFFNKDNYIYELIFERNDIKNPISGSLTALTDNYLTIFESFEFIDNTDDLLLKKQSPI